MPHSICSALHDVNPNSKKIQKARHILKNSVNVYESSDSSSSEPTLEYNQDQSTLRKPGQ